MAAGNELGITCNVPYGTFTGTGNAYFVSTAYVTEVPKFARIYTSVFPRIRIIANISPGDFGTTYPNNYTQANQLWASGIKSYSPNTYILYGDTNNGWGFNAANYSTYSTYLQSDVAWARDNGMSAFCIGNENLITASHSTNAMVVSSLSRTSNVATATFSSDHGLTTGDYIIVSGASPSNFNVTENESITPMSETVQCTVVDSTTVTYPSTGSNGSATGTIKMNWSALEVVRKTKALAVICRSIAPNLVFEYSESQGHQNAWITLGITPGVDIDLIGFNLYGSSSNENDYLTWKAQVDTVWSAFGSTLIITEHNVVQDSGNKIILNFNKTNMGAQFFFDREIIRRYNYLKNLGITQIYLFGASEYVYFANNNPWAAVGGTGYTTAYWRGDFKALVDQIRGKRTSHVFWGLNTQG